MYLSLLNTFLYLFDLLCLRLLQEHTKGDKYREQGQQRKRKNRGSYSRGEIMAGLLLRLLLINALWPFAVKRQRHCTESKCIFKQADAYCTSHSQQREPEHLLLSGSHFHVKQDIRCHQSKVADWRWVSTRCDLKTQKSTVLLALDWNREVESVAYCLCA